MSRTGNLKVWVATLLATAAAAAMVVGFTSPAQAANAGDLDPSFSGDGKVVTSFGGSLIGEAVAIQGNGKIIVAGTNWEYDGGDHDADFALARYYDNGSLDPTFDSDGKLTTGLGGQDEAYAVAIQTNIPFDHRTRIVVAGHKSGKIALARYYVNGSLDSGFDGDGKVVTDFGGSAAAIGVAIQGNGRIVVAGANADGGDIDIVLARYAADGDLDASFSGDGKVETDFGGWVWGQAVAIQKDGKIVVAGLNWPGGSGSSDEDFALARYATDGSLDPSFDGNGKQATGFGDRDQAQAVAIQPDGRIVAAGSTNAGGDADFAIARYHATNRPQ